MFALYLEGVSLQKICDDLNESGYRTVHGCLFREASLMIMIRNEVYAGDILRQKSYMADPITKNKVKNQGEFPKYYMPDTHETIIDRDTYAKVQEEIARRSSLLNPMYCFTGKLRCGICGMLYTRKISYNHGKKYVHWICRAKKRKGDALQQYQFHGNETRRNLYRRAWNRWIFRETFQSASPFYDSSRKWGYCISARWQSTENLEKSAYHRNKARFHSNRLLSK